jgi:hypothetical protein
LSEPIRRRSAAFLRDPADLIAEGGEMAEPLGDCAFFTRIFLDGGILIWPNGFDLDSIALHMDMKKRGLLRRTAASAGRPGRRGKAVVLTIDNNPGDEA